MAVIASNLDSGKTTSGVSSQATNSVSIPANALILVTVGSYNTVALTTPTLTGASMTWVAVATAAGTVSTTTVFRGMSAGAHSGALTIDFAGNGQTGIFWSIDKFTGVVTTGTNGSGAVVQSVTGTQVATATSLSLSLAALGAGNASFGGIFGAFAADTSITAGSGYAELSQQETGLAMGSPPNGISETEWKAAGQTTVNWTWTSAVTDASGVGIEIAAAPITFIPAPWETPDFRQPIVSY